MTWPASSWPWGSTTDWYTHLAGLTRRAGRRAVVHAHQLVTDRPMTLQALRAGEASPTQAAIICDAVDTLPSSPALRERGERVLLDEAQRLNATDLARTARHLAHVVDPDRTERADEAALERQERAAHTGRFLSVTDDGAGGIRIKGEEAPRTAPSSARRFCPSPNPHPPPPQDASDQAVIQCARRARPDGRRGPRSRDPPRPPCARTW